MRKNTIDMDRAIYYLSDEEERTVIFKNSTPNKTGRRTGKTCLIIAKAIVEILETGECIIVDDDHRNRTEKFYTVYLLIPFLKQLSTLLKLDKQQIENTFDWHFIQKYDRNICLGIKVTANNKGKYQY